MSILLILIFNEALLDLNINIINEITSSQQVGTRIDEDILIDRIDKSNSSIMIGLTFLEPTKNRNFTRFILSKTAPVLDFSIIESETLFTDDIKGIGSAPILIGMPNNLNGYNLYPIIIKPVFKNDKMAIYCRKIQLNLEFDRYSSIKISPCLGSVYKNLILNYEYNPEAKPQGLLIITPNSFYNAVLPLADWKEKKGWKVTVARLSETGSSNTAIKNYISNAYHGWNPPPEYVLLIGDKDSLPAFVIPFSPNLTDHPYTTVDGNDFFSDLLVGRLSVSNVNELNTVVAKILGYEKDPYTAETEWFKRGLMVGANYPSGMTTPIPTKRWIREMVLNHWFTQVDTVYYPPTSSGQVPITNSVNQGVTFINYRGGIASWNGWDFPSFYNADVGGLSNGWKLPVITSIVCNSGNFNANCFGETWLRAGSPATPKGAVAFFGATPPTTHSRWNNCLDNGIYWGLIEDSIYYLGPMTYRGKMEVYLNFPLEPEPDSGSEFYFNAYNLLGDPSLEVWTDVPQNFIVNYPSSIPVGTNSFSVQVLNLSSQPVKGAIVSLYKKDETKEVEFTDVNGIANFQILTSTPDTLFVTVTKHNFKPYCGYCLVNNSTVYVGYYSHTISDVGGNNNGEVNPGEFIAMVVTLKNYGTSTTATNVSAKLSSTDQLVTIIDSIKNYGSIAPGDSAIAGAYAFLVSTNTKNNHVIKFDLSITSFQGNWNSVLWLAVKAPEFNYQTNQILDGGNGVLEPGETSDLIISIENIGGLIGTNINGILRSNNPGVLVVDSIGLFGNIPVGDSATNSGDHFRVSASSLLAPGHQIKFSALLSGNDDFKDTVDFSIIIGVMNANSPLGPDGYGYYAYDDTDTGYPETPIYNWVEIDPDLGGSGTILPLLNDDAKTIYLPFNFKYYGDFYNKISVCSNGYIAMDSTWLADMYNWHIPSSLGPPCLIAPFWDDLDPNATDSSGNICYWFDSSNYRFIIEYSRIQHLHNPTSPTPGELQTFEVILFDPQYYPTETGDGEILFQYKKINNDDNWHNYATVGIENKEHTIGLEYSFANIYPSAASPLTNSRAIKFTTDRSDTFPEVWEETSIKIQDIELEIYPNPFREKTYVKLQIPSLIKSGTKPQTSLNIYDTSGRLVKTFSLQSSISNLISVVTWHGEDNSGRALPAGVYIIGLKTDNFREIKKVILLK